jgi:hypothetical protein
MASKASRSSSPNFTNYYAPLATITSGALSGSATSSDSEQKHRFFGKTFEQDQYNCDDDAHIISADDGIAKNEDSAENTDDISDGQPQQTAEVLIDDQDNDSIGSEDSLDAPLSTCSFFDRNAEHQDMVHADHPLTQEGGVCAMVADRSKRQLNSPESYQTRVVACCVQRSNISAGNANAYPLSKTSASVMS